MNKNKIIDPLVRAYTSGYIDSQAGEPYIPEVVRRKLEIILEEIEMGKNMSRPKLKNQDRYWQPVVCEICEKHMGFAPYGRDAYQCVSCNDLPLHWDSDKTWLELYNKTWISEEIRGEQ